MDFLKEHLSDELFNQLTEALKDKGEVVKLANLASGEFVRKDKFDGELGRAKSEIADLQGEIEKLQGDLKKASEATGDINEIKANADKAKQESEDRLKQMQADAASKALDYEIRLAVLAAGAKDEKSVIAHLDKEKIAFGEDGKLSGIDEQISTIAENHKYLFGEPKTVYTSTPPNPPPADPETSPDSWKAKHKKAIEAGSTVEAIKIKQAAAKEGVILT